MRVKGCSDWTKGRTDLLVTRAQFGSPVSDKYTGVKESRGGTTTFFTEFIEISSTMCLKKHWNKYSEEV